MSPSNADTQPVRAIRSGPSCLKRIIQFFVLAIFAVGIFAVGYATGTGVEILAPANALIETAVASLPDSLQTQWARSLRPTFTPHPTDTYTPVPSDTDTPIPSDLPTATPALLNMPSRTAVPTSTRTDSPVPTDTPTNTSIPTATELPPTQTPVPTDTPTPTATEPPPTQTPLPTATQPPPTPTTTAPSCYRHPQVWVTGEMNVRAQPSINAQKRDPAQPGERFDVLESRQGDRYCWLRINRGWMAVTGLVSATEPQQPAPSAADGGVRQALANLNALVVAPENRCSPYDSDSYPYSQSVEGQIVARMGGRIYGPYTGTTFSSTGETDIEHIVAKAEAHDSGLCSASAQTRRAFSNDLLNLTLAQGGGRG